MKENLKTRVLGILRENCAGGELPRAESELSALNLDSLSFIAALVGIEEAFGVEFDAEELNMKDYETAGDLIAAVRRKKRERKAKKDSERD